MKTELQSLSLSRVHSHQLLSVADIFHDPGKEVSDELRQEFSQLQVPDLRSLIFCFIVRMEYILCSDT